MPPAAGRGQRRWRPPGVVVAAALVAGGVTCLVATLGAAATAASTAGVPPGAAVAHHPGTRAALARAGRAAGGAATGLAGAAVVAAPGRGAGGELALPAVVLRRVEELRAASPAVGAPSASPSGAGAGGFGAPPRRSLASSPAARRWAEDAALPPVVRSSAAAAGGAKAAGVNAELTNVTLVLRELEVGPQIYDEEHWMFTNGDRPFTYSGNHSQAYFANRRFSWNARGQGNGDCPSAAPSGGGGAPTGRHPTEGSGRASAGQVDDATVALGLPLSQLPVSWADVEVVMDGFVLESFTHMNMRTGSQEGRNWAVMGAAGDERTYQNGSVEVWEKGGSSLLSAYDVRWVQNVSYPSPFGPSDTETYQIGAYLIGRYNASRTSATWASRLDPEGHGIFLAVLQSVAMSTAGCYGANNYWFTVRPLPSAAATALASVAGQGGGDAADGNRRLPVHRHGRAIASSDDAVAASNAMGGTAAVGATVLVVSSAVMALGGAAVGMAGGSSSVGPGQSVIHAVSAAAFIGMMGQVNTFHSDAFDAFSNNFDSFLLRDKAAPWSDGPDDQPSATARSAVRAVVDAAVGTVRQSTAAAAETPERNSIAHDLFVGCAFYATIIVAVALFIHGLVAVFTWRKPMSVQLRSHQWMVYLLALVLTYIFPAAVLNSLQYLLVNVPNGTGRTILYVVAGLQLSIIGVGYTFFFMLVIAYAIHQQRLKKVRWVKREEAPDPEVRQDRFIAGVYEADGDVPVEGSDDESVPGGDGTRAGSSTTASTTARGRRARRLHAFHELFACYYDFLRGPLVWLAVIELIVILTDCIFVATISNEVLVLSLMLGVHSALFALFLFLSPFSDKIEGVFFSLVTVLELLMIVMEFASIFSADPLAEQLNLTLVVLGFMTMGLVILCAVWTDVYPLLCVIWATMCAKVNRWRYRGRAPSSGASTGRPVAAPHVTLGSHCAMCEEVSGRLDPHAASAAASKGFSHSSHSHTHTHSHGAGSSSSHAAGSSAPYAAGVAGGPTALVRSASAQSGASSWSGLASTAADDLEQQALVGDVPEPVHRAGRAASGAGVTR